MYSGCENSDARAFVTDFKGVSNNKGKLHPHRENPHFKTFPISCKLPFVFSTATLAFILKPFVPFFLPIDSLNTTGWTIQSDCIKDNILQSAQRRRRLSPSSRMRKIGMSTSTKAFKTNANENYATLTQLPLSYTWWLSFRRYKGLNSIWKEN